MSVAANPQVTAVLTTYRPKYDYLALAIESALAQSVPVQVLVSDSGGDDAVRNFVLRYGDRVWYRRNATAVGPAENHRHAIADVRTPYLALLGHDDLWESDFLGTLVPELDAHPECILAFSDHWLVDSTGRVDHALTNRMSAHWGRTGLQEGVIRDVTALLMAQTVPVAMAALLRTTAAQRHPIPDLSGPAYDLWLHYALASEQQPYWYSPRRLTQWRFHGGAGTSEGNPDWYRGSAFTWDEVSADPLFATGHRIAHRRAAVAWLSLAKSLLRRGVPVAEVQVAAENAMARDPSLQARFALRAPRLLRWLLAAHDVVRRA